ncbi:MAG TPA: plastocyanin/azurin family copper-binding protein [Solirubrobacteraceae bacterium]
MDRRIALVVVALLGAATALLPAFAGSETLPAIEAVNVGGGIYGEEHHWSPAQLSVAVGATVSLSNPSEVKHGVNWVGGPSTPSCTAGVPVGNSVAASGAKWSGSCTFATAGIYTFYCTVHGAAMTARVSVGEAAATTPTSSTPTSSTPTYSTPGSTGTSAYPPPSEAGGAVPPPPPGGALLSGAAAKALRFTAARGATIRGSVGLSAAAAGGRLAVEVLLRRGAHLVRVGQLIRSGLHAGILTFTLRLDADAARSLHSHHRLALTLRLALRPPRGATLRITRSLVLHR